jgi:hypothetical protein
MRKFFDKLANMAKRAWNWLKGTRPAKFVARCYDRAIMATGPKFLSLMYGGPRRQQVFNTTAGLIATRTLWELILAPVTVGFMAWEGLKALGRGSKTVAKTATRWTLTGLGYAWAALSVLWTVEVAFYAWIGNTALHAIVRPTQKLYAWVTDTNPRMWTRYMGPREVLAFELAVWVPVHAGLLHLSRRLVDDTHTWRVVQFVTDTVARLHGPTYDWFFGTKLPYGTPQDGGEITAMIVTDVPVEATLETPVSEAEKSENWFVSNGYILIAQPGEDKTDVAIFNEYVRDRWATLTAAEIATDEHGRTWVVPFKDEPLFKDVATDTLTTRNYADQEMTWMTTKDKVARSTVFGRHWAAALADQDPRFLEDSALRTRERAFMAAKIKGRADLHVEHILKGFDAWVGEHASVNA